MKYNKNFKIALGLISDKFRHDYNSVRVSTANSLEHELKKLIIAYKLILDKKTILTEVIFKNGKRADILVLDDLRVYEVLHSETEKEALEKTKDYPSELDIVLLDTKDIIAEVETYGISFKNR